MRNIHILWVPAALLTGAALIAACGDLTQDPSFDRWCGDSLCNWELDEGRIERVATWHERDYAVHLLDSPTQLSQLSERSSVQCISFALIVDAEASAELSLQLDFNDDRRVDYVRKLPAVRWKRMGFTVHAPEHYKKLRFIVRKQGKGRAVIAQLHAVESEDCAGPRVDLSELRPGAPCSQDDQCSSGLCTERRCSDCAADDDCGDAEVCVSGACSPCREDADCASDQRCAWREASARGAGRMCVPESENLARVPGELCDSDADCAETDCCGGVCSAQSGPCD
jgi:hypothetical protein